MSIESNLSKINNDLKNSNAQLLAVSKFVESVRMAQAIKAGQKLFGENYIQEAKKKNKELIELGFDDFEMHFIGSLQSNKVKDAVGLFSLIHSVDRPSLAKAISKEAVKKSITQDILLQINISGEQSKSGANVEDFEALLELCTELKSLRVRGIMSIGSSGLSREFEQMQQIFNQYQDKFLEKKELSMGMSNDYKLAIEHGATIVRLGTSIFGQRKAKI